MLRHNRVVPAAYLVLALLLPLAKPLAQTAAAPDVPRVTIVTKLGTLEGKLEHGTRVLRGIPFAAPPLGELRWAPPAPPRPWREVRDATRFGAGCPAPASALPGAKGAPNEIHGPGYDIWFGKMIEGGSEDCLTLNVWMPDPAPSGAPVMVFFPPTGNGSLPFFDGASFARDGVVFVSANNRLFAQASFAHPALARAQLPGKPHTDLVELDRIAALEWVRANIRAFGGNPANVTVFGESNSAVSILKLIATPRAKGLFRRAIVQSGSSRGGGQLSYEALERLGSEFARMAGLDGAQATLEQLRALPIDALPFFAGGVADPVLERSVEDSFAIGKTLDVALMIGGNDWDGSSLRYAPAEILARTPTDVLAAYEREHLSGDALAYAVYTDEHVNAPARWYAAAQARRGAPVYLYVYSHVSSFRKNQPGAAHGDELPFVFDSWHAMPGIAKIIDERDRRVTQIMHDCWVAFARTGKPECAGAPQWPAYDETSDWTMELSAAPQLHQHYRREQFAAQDREQDRAKKPAADGSAILEALRAAD